MAKTKIGPIVPSNEPEIIIEIDESGHVSDEIKPTDAIPTPPKKEELTGMAKRIEIAREFNTSLTTPKSTVVTAQQVVMNKDTELKSILKRYGMDSQQQEKAFTEIKSLFQ